MTNLFDAMVFLPVCDIPAIVVTGGYMRLNRFKGRRLDPLDVAARHYQDFKAGDLTEVEFCEVKNRGCPGTGACPVMGNTMAALAEALSMTPYMGYDPAGQRIGSRSGFPVAADGIPGRTAGICCNMGSGPAGY